MNFEERIARLEAQNGRLLRQVRILRRTGLAALLAAGGVFLAGADLTQNQVVSASKFQLVDADGKPRGEWTVAGSNARLELRSSNGDPTVVIEADGQGQQGGKLHIRNVQNNRHFATYSHEGYVVREEVPGSIHTGTRAGIEIRTNDALKFKAPSAN